MPCSSQLVSIKIHGNKNSCLSAYPLIIRVMIRKKHRHCGASYEKTSDVRLDFDVLELKIAGFHVLHQTKLRNGTKGTG